MHGPDARLGLRPEVAAATELLAGYRAIERPQGSIEYLNNTVSAAAHPLERNSIFEAMASQQRQKTCRGHGHRLLRGAGLAFVHCRSHLLAQD